MDSFEETLSNGSVVTGITSIPPPVNHAPHYKPLIVALHGAGYNCQYFDADTRRTASISSKSYGVPFIAVNRPCYGSTSVLPIPKNSNYPAESAAWLHSSALPLLWRKFGIPEACTCIILLCHSLGVAVGVATAAKHADDTALLYPLGGLICSAMGHRSKTRAAAISYPDKDPKGFFVTDAKAKDETMFAPGTFDPEILKQSERLNQAIPYAEAMSAHSVIAPHWRSLWAQRVVVPVLFALPERDSFFEGTREHVKECVVAFSRSKSVEGSLVLGAPHCLELSHWSSGWYAKCFGFAMECAASYASGEER